jgi:hypothetical protein
MINPASVINARTISVSVSCHSIQRGPGQTSAVTEALSIHSAIDSRVCMEFCVATIPSFIGSSLDIIYYMALKLSRGKLLFRRLATLLQTNSVSCGVEKAPTTAQSVLVSMTTHLLILLMAL